MIIRAIKTRIFIEREDLSSFVTSHIWKVPEESILVITSKIAALSEGRTLAIKNSRTKERAIRSESSIALRTKYVWFTIKDGVILPSAGIDESNANGKFILLPRDSFKSASLIRKKLMKHYGVRKLGVIITDSKVTPLRAGVMGIALGYAGFKGLKDYRGKPDLYGRIMEFSSVDVADSLATAATLLMGEGDEKHPIALIKDAPVTFCERVNRNELRIAIEDDMYQPLLQKLAVKH